MYQTTRKRRCTYQKSKQKKQTQIFILFLISLSNVLDVQRYEKEEKNCRKYQTHDYYHSEVDLNKTHGRFSAVDFAQN